MVSVLPEGLADADADHVRDAGLVGGELPVIASAIRQPFEAVADRDAHFADAAVLQLGQHRELELRALRAVTGQNPLMSRSPLTV